MNIYRTAPQQERKARDELRRSGVKAYLPLEDRVSKARRRSKAPIIPGYIFADEKPAQAQYVKAHIGQIERADLSPLYVKRKMAEPQTERPFKKGDRVLIKLSTGDKLGSIEQLRGRVAIVHMDGAHHTMSISMVRLERLA